VISVEFFTAVTFELNFLSFLKETYFVLENFAGFMVKKCLALGGGRQILLEGV
jgi:hypothetical protein